MEVSCEAHASQFMCEKHPTTHFQPPGGAVKHVLAYLSASKNEESSVHYCGSPVKVQVLFMGGKHITTAFKPPRGCWEARAGLFKFKYRWIKQFSPLWRSCEARASMFRCGNTLQRRFKRRRGAMKHVKSCLRASKGGESSFHYCGGPVKLVQASLWAVNTLQRHLNRRGGAIKHVQVGFCASSDRESGFHHCGDPVKLVQACLYAENTLQRRFNRRGGAVKHLHACLSQ